MIGAKESAEADLLVPSCSDDTQELYSQTKLYMGGKWLMLNVTSEEVLEDVKRLIALRISR